MISTVGPYPICEIQCTICEIQCTHKSVTSFTISPQSTSLGHLELLNLGVANHTV